MSKPSDSSATSASVKQRSLISKISYALFIALVILLVFIAIALATLSQTVPIAAEHFFKRYDIDFTIESMDISVLRGELSAGGMNVKDLDSSESLSAKHIHLGLDLMQLLRAREVIIKRIELQGIDIPIVHEGDAISVAGISPERFASATDSETDSEPQPDVEASGFGGTLAWSAIELDDIGVDYMRIENDAVVNIPLNIEQVAIGAFTSMLARDNQSEDSDVAGQGFDERGA